MLVDQSRVTLWLGEDGEALLAMKVSGHLRNEHSQVMGAEGEILMENLSSELFRGE